jgi:hypothetical protein
MEKNIISKLKNEVIFWKNIITFFVNVETDTSSICSQCNNVRANPTSENAY